MHVSRETANTICKIVKTFLLPGKSMLPICKLQKQTAKTIYVSRETKIVARETHQKNPLFSSNILVKSNTLNIQKEIFTNHFIDFFLPVPSFSGNLLWINIQAKQLYPPV